MRVSEAMTRDVRAGALPVGDEDRLVGMITDRDIALRAVAHGKSPDTRIRDVMTDDVKYCFDDDEVEQVARNMGDIQVRRLPVVNRDKRLVGIVSLADIAASEEPEVVGGAVSGISEPSGKR
jgi:CBS domain-containing protein